MSASSEVTAIEVQGWCRQASVKGETQTQTCDKNTTPIAQPQKVYWSAPDHSYNIFIVDDGDDADDVAKCHILYYYTYSP